MSNFKYKKGTTTTPCNHFTNIVRSLISYNHHGKPYLSTIWDVQMLLLTDTVMILNDRKPGTKIYNQFESFRN